jgi:hypothetical protein
LVVDLDDHLDVDLEPWKVLTLGKEMVLVMVVWLGQQLDLLGQQLDTCHKPLDIHLLRQIHTHGFGQYTK